LGEISLYAFSAAYSHLGLYSVVAEVCYLSPMYCAVFLSESYFINVSVVTDEPIRKLFLYFNVLMY